MRPFAIGLVVAVLPLAARADEVFLKGGGQLSGRVVSRSATEIEVDVGAGTIGVPVSSVLRIEEGRSPLDEYDERASRLLAGDADGWVALGDWASSRGLGSQAREAYGRALAASPLDPRANEALGNVLVDGRWVSEEEGYRARGYVQHEGDWVTPAERDATLREQAAQADADRARQEADARVREAEERAAEAEARAREAEQASQGYTWYGYGWGGGPAYWPSRPVVATRPTTRPVARPR
jgi:hypothetical protein